MPIPRPRTRPDTRPAPDQILIFGGSSRTLDLLRLATIRSDSVLLVGRAFDAPVTRCAAHFAVEIREPGRGDPDLGAASAVLVALGDVEAENRIVRAARRGAVPVFVADRALVSDFTLIEFLERRPHTSQAA